MNAEFHYYVVYALCLRANFNADEALRIARSSQFVDEATRLFEVDDGRSPYRAIVTQDYSFWDGRVANEVYLPFHFLPGDPARTQSERVDGLASPFAASPDSPLSKELLVEALKTHNPFRIGIALHAYADSFAHQHFSGRREEANTADPGSPLPPVGHLQAQRRPDEALCRWIDPRLSPPYTLVDNRARFLAAVRKIYRYLRTYQRLPFTDEDTVTSEFAWLWRGEPPAEAPLHAAGSLGVLGAAAKAAARAALGETAARGRAARSRHDDFIIEFGIPPHERGAWFREAGLGMLAAEPASALEAGYDRLTWLGERVRAQDEPRRLSSGGHFEGSDLHQWYEAARAHREAARRALRGLGIPEVAE